MNPQKSKTFQDILSAHRSTIGEIYQLHHAALEGFIRARVGVREDAQDIIQETFVILLDRYLQSGRVPDNVHPKALLYRIARSQISQLYMNRMDENWLKKYYVLGAEYLMEPPSANFRREYKKDYKVHNLAKIVAARKDYHIRNRDIENARSKAYNAAHKEKIAEKRRAYYQAHRERWNLYKKQRQRARTAVAV